MPLKILHTADLHIGMTFRHYPDDLREMLMEARFSALERLVALGVDHQCHLLVIAGDLFEKQSVAGKDLQRVKHLLSRFSTGTVCILPGNHDYINDSTELWHTFCRDLPDNLLVLKAEKTITLQEGDYTITMYPAPCHAKHSDTHNLGWLEDLMILPENRGSGHFHIGVAHGALAGISPDLSGQYYTMFPETLQRLPQDLWLLGHTHLPYPPENHPRGAKVFNAGTPEPDGMDCRHDGSAWFIQLLENASVEAEQLKTGTLRFLDVTETVENEESFHRLKEKYLQGIPQKILSRTLLRLKLSGYLDEEANALCQPFCREMEEALAYFTVDDSDLRVRFSPERITEEFTEGSLPAVLLQELVKSQDEDTAHLAYEIIREVKKHAD
jgi:DNA repair protein SbcD/Mre11